MLIYQLVDYTFGKEDTILITENLGLIFEIYNLEKEYRELEIFVWRNGSRASIEEIVASKNRLLN